MALSFKREMELKHIARTIRKKVIQTLYTVQTGHPGGSLSCVEILTALYFEVMNFGPAQLKSPDRERVILSKGHACPTLYVILAELGIIPQTELATLRQLGSRLQGHPDMRKTPGIEAPSGPLGLGLSTGLGMALAARLNKQSYHTYVILGDGELQEGIIWEAAMAAAKYKLDNLVAIVDWNGVQLDGTVDEVMPLGDLKAKFSSFGWHALTADGHDFASMLAALEDAHIYKGKPTVILAKTVKGKGVSFMEGDHKWHGKPLGEEEFKQALGELEVGIGE